MKLQKILLFLIFTIILSSCSSVQVSQDFDNSYTFTNAKTYNWNKDIQNSTEDLLQKDDLLAQRVYKAIDTNLQLQGYVLSDTPDFLLSCSYTVTSRLQTDSVQPTIGVGYGRYGRYGGVGVQSGTSVRQYDRGMLNINIHSAVDNKLIWKGTGTREVFTHSKPDQITKAVNEMVQSILSQFPPTQ